MPQVKLLVELFDNRSAFNEVHNNLSVLDDLHCRHTREGGQAVEFRSGAAANGEARFRRVLVRGNQAIVDNRANVWDRDHNHEAYEIQDLLGPLPRPSAKTARRKRSPAPGRKSHPASRITQRFGDELRTLARVKTASAPVITVFRADFGRHLFCHQINRSLILIRFNDSCDCTVRWPDPPT